jgi:hypothetical protein
MRVSLHDQRNRREVNIDTLNIDFELQKSFHVLFACVSEVSESDALTGTHFAQRSWLIRR